MLLWLQEHFGAAAALLKMAEHQELTAEESRKLQEQLARERLAARRNNTKAAGATTPEAEDTPILDSNDTVGLKVRLTIFPAK